MSKIKIIDITLELGENIKIYEGDPHIRLEKFYSIETNGFALTKMSMGSHSGTHVDAPSHVIPMGKNVREIPLSCFVGECVVVDNNKVPENTKKLLMKSTDKCEAMLNEKQAKQLADAGVKLIGTDALSIGNDKVHEILLSEECVILESLKLNKAEAGKKYFLCALPLKLNTDGAPLRACLIEGWGE
ncbi:MAG: cyclase family protein [Christensenellaceae bacterium]